MDTLVRDVRYALRGFLRSPGFTLVVLLTVGLGTGTNATVFSFVNALLLRPVTGVADPESLVAVYTSDYSSGPYGDNSYPDYLSIKSEAPALAALAVYDEGPALVKTGDAVLRIGAMQTSPEFFEVLGLRPEAGRLLGRTDAEGGAPLTAVIGYDLWQRAFGGQNIGGISVAVDGAVYEVVGVAPPRFDGLRLGSGVELWTPLGEAARRGARDSRGLSIVGRLARGASLEEAQAQVTAIAARLGAAYPGTNLGTLDRPGQPRPISVLRHTRLHPAFRGDVTLLGTVMLGAVGLVLLIACANVGNLLLARAAVRGREVALRIALGAGHGRIVRQVLTESALLAVAGGALGLLFALWTSDVLPAFFPPEQARMLDATIDGRVLLYTLAISLGSSLLFGAAPALQAFGVMPAASLRGESGATSSARGGRLRSLLMTAQIALALVLLVSAGLLVRSLGNATNADLGFASRNGVVASIDLPLDRGSERGLACFDSALERLRALPGVVSASVADTLPLSGTPRRGFRMEGYERRPGEDGELPLVVVSPEYFSTLQIPLTDGRTFEPADRAGSRPVAVVNELLARQYFGGKAVGRTMTDSRGTEVTIVGVVRTGKYRSVQEPERPVVYYPLAQAYGPQRRVIVRADGDPAALAGAVRRALMEVDRDAAVYRVITLESHLAEALADARLTATLVTACGGLALLLSLVGVYGVVSYGVGRRAREIGLRMALGAQPLHIVRLVIGEGSRILIAGVVTGLLGAVLATRLLQSLLFGVSALDTATFVTVTIALGIAALAAAALPARRALQVDPIAELRG